MKKLDIRKANKRDISFILEMIYQLAIYEKAQGAVAIDKEQLEKDFKDNLFEAIIFEVDSKSVGMALFYFRYSTWKGKNLYLEDLFILPEYRGLGLGKKAMYYLACYAVEQSCGRFEWQVLDWNTPSIEFYKALGAQVDPEWMNCRVEGEAIKELASLAK